MSDVQEHTHDEHRDDEGAKLGMWLFIFTELLFFGGLFISYSVFRFNYSTAFHLAGQELDVTIGTINTVILLISSMTIAMSISAIQMGKKKLTLVLVGITLLLALVFLVNKYFEWTTKFSHGIYPGSEMLAEYGKGEIIFFALYFAMTGLHALHIIIGIVFIAITMFKIKQNAIKQDDHVYLENIGLYWHLVDLIWIFLFPLFYLIA